MNKLTSILIFSFWGLISFGQNSSLIGFDPSTCDFDEDVSKIRDRISEIYTQGDTLFISVGFVANCGYSDFPLIADAIFENDTLYLSYDYKKIIDDTLYENGDTIYELKIPEYECDCCYEFKYLIKNVVLDSVPVKLNQKLILYYPEKYKTYLKEYKVLKGDTINLIDKYGYR